MAFVPLLLGWAIRSQDFISRTIKLWASAIVWASGIDLRIEGDVPKEGVFVVIANHSSILDIPVLLVVLKNLDIRFVSRQSLFFVPVLGQAMFLAGCPRINRRDPSGSLHRLMTLDHIERGQSLMIFPEGTRSIDGRVSKFKGGAFLISAHNKAPILPVRLSGLFNSMPKNSFLPKPTRVKACIGPLMLARSTNQTDRLELGKRARDFIVDIT